MPTPNTFLEYLKIQRCIYPGFTLVEIVIVTCIIGLLMTLMFPGYAAVKRKSSQAVCASNMKQVGTSILLFAADNDGWLPPGPATHTINSFISDSRFGSDTSNVVDTSNLEYYLTNYITTKSIGGKKRKGNPVFSCPAHDEKRPLIWKRGSCFGGAGGQFGTDGSIKLINIDKSDFFLVDLTKAFTNHSATTLNRTVKNPHGSRRNLLKTDGSVTTELDNKAR